MATVRSLGASQFKETQQTLLSFKQQPTQQENADDSETVAAA